MNHPVAYRCSWYGEGLSRHKWFTRRCDAESLAIAQKSVGYRTEVAPEYDRRILRFVSVVTPHTPVN